MEVNHIHNCLSLSFSFTRLCKNFPTYFGLSKAFDYLYNEVKHNCHLGKKKKEKEKNHVNNYKNSNFVTFNST